MSVTTPDDFNPSPDDFRDVLHTMRVSRRINEIQIKALEFYVEQRPRMLEEIKRLRAELKKYHDAEAAKIKRMYDNAQPKPDPNVQSVILLGCHHHLIQPQNTTTNQGE